MSAMYFFFHMPCHKNLLCYFSSHTYQILFCLSALLNSLPSTLNYLSLKIFLLSLYARPHLQSSVQIKLFYQLAFLNIV